MFTYSEFSMATEVIAHAVHILGREVAYYVRDRFIDEIKKLPSFKNRQYS